MKKYSFGIYLVPRLILFPAGSQIEPGEQIGLSPDQDRFTKRKRNTKKDEALILKA